MLLVKENNAPVNFDISESEFELLDFAQRKNTHTHANAQARMHTQINI